ncbi:hypothetical protein JSY14_02830 [Brachybacterium sp. EF45031]|uniref:DUF6912 family protein n=1 Tax=Brachybacterium sillae TaxID=2810536 RepID=UPI00217EFEFD|nr:hypothetical protein [Brachybacterium sillae]MCS6710999.1 hypothetical protein [Brachybacterium sillae]
MRVYLPLAPALHEAVRSGAAEIMLTEVTPAWALTPAARAERPGEDAEDLEYDAVQDAAHVAIQGAIGRGTGAERAVVLAADAPSAAVQEAGAEGGAYGVLIAAGSRLRPASIHVTELTAAAADADDTDPALLWFDRAEGSVALDYAREAQ